VSDPAAVCVERTPSLSYILLFPTEREEMKEGKKIVLRDVFDDVSKYFREIFQFFSLLHSPRRLNGALPLNGASCGGIGVIDPDF
jgi:hypothetical protein